MNESKFLTKGNIKAQLIPNLIRWGNTNKVYRSSSQLQSSQGEKETRRIEGTIVDKIR